MSYHFADDYGFKIERVGPRNKALGPFGVADDHDMYVLQALDKPEPFRVKGTYMVLGVTREWNCAAGQGVANPPERHGVVSSAEIPYQGPYDSEGYSGKGREKGKQYVKPYGPEGYGVVGPEEYGY